MRRQWTSTAWSAWTIPASVTMSIIAISACSVSQPRPALFSAAFDLSQRNTQTALTYRNHPRRNRSSHHSRRPRSLPPGLEDMAVEAHRAHRLTGAQLGRVLGIPSRYELDAFLKERGVWLEYTLRISGAKERSRRLCWHAKESRTSDTAKP
jgi:hypothetical protein